MKKLDLVSAAKDVVVARKLKNNEVPQEQRLALAEAVFRGEVTHGQAVRALANAMGASRSNATTALYLAVYSSIRNGDRKLVKP